MIIQAEILNHYLTHGFTDIYWVYFNEFNNQSYQDYKAI